VKKLNSSVYKKLYAQAEEAKLVGLNKLASDIFDVIGPYADDDKSEYAYSDLKDDVHRDLWRVATRLMHYYDVKSVDAKKLNEIILVLASDTISELENKMNVDPVSVHPLEPKVPGEK
jgi:hypothetical protein